MAGLSSLLTFDNKMKPLTQRRRYLTGILIGVGAAYLWALMVFSFYAASEGWFGPGIFLVAAYAVLLASWYVIPMGAGVGHILPGLVTEDECGKAVFRGVLMGVSCGALAAALTAIIEQWAIITGAGQIVDFSAWWRHELRRLALHGVSMAVVSAICLGAWAYIMNKKSKPWVATFHKPTS